MRSAQLDALVRSLAGPFAFAGVTVARSDEVLRATATAKGIWANENSLFRVASVSKIVTGLTLTETVLRSGMADALGHDVSDILGWSLRHPGYPDQKITLGMLASHAAGLTDMAGYAVPVNQTLPYWMRMQGGAVFGPHRPGTHFAYSNLGYILLAACIERLGKVRFDLRARTYVLGPAKMLGGFNWSGTPSEVRRRSLATFRKAPDGKFVPQIDRLVAPEGVLGVDGVAHPLANYKLGSNPGLFGPQGGLRISLRGMLRLGRALARVQHPVLWSPEMGTMDSVDGLFDQYGAGVQILRAPPFYPRPLIGHFGNAYGFRGGVWYDREANMAFAMVLNGVPVGDESDALSEAERRIFDAVAALEG